jgi:uncharacterized membrane protein YccC
MVTIDDRRRRPESEVSPHGWTWQKILKLPDLARFLETHSVALTPEQIGLMEGLRAATAVATVVAIAWSLNAPTLGWAAFGAFWTCLSDPGGPDRDRAFAMGGFALAGTIIAPLASAMAAFGPPTAALVIFVVVLLCSLSRALGQAAAQSGMLASVVAVVAVSFPRSPIQGIELGGIFLAGSLWALMLCLLLWRIHPHAPARRSLVAVYARLDDMLSDLLVAFRTPTIDKEWTAQSADHRRSVRNAIERSHALVVRLPDKGDIERGYISATLDLADQVFAMLIAIGHNTRNGVPESDRADFLRTMENLRKGLAEVSKQSARRVPNGQLLADLAYQMNADRDRHNRFFSKVNKQCATAFGWAARQYPPFTAGPNPNRAQTDANDRAAPGSLTPSVLRYALRTALAVVIAFAAAQALDLANSFWATMATVVVMQPGASATWRRSIERILGSIAGGIIAAAGTVLLSTQGAVVLAIFPIAAATIALRSVSYTLFVAFLTPLFVFVSELLQPGHGLAWARAVDNVVGSLVGIAISSLWPERVKDEMEATVAKAVRANLAYADLVMRGANASDIDIRRARRASGIASTAAETCRQRLVLDGRRRSARLDEVADVLTGLRNLAGATTVLWLEGDGKEFDGTRIEEINRLEREFDTGSYIAPLDCGARNIGESSAEDFSVSVRNLRTALASYYAARVQGRPPLLC